MSRHHLVGIIRQLFTSRVYLQRVALLNVPSQKLLGQWILQEFLHSLDRSLY
jgi:hypothetical protein